ITLWHYDASDRITHRTVNGEPAEQWRYNDHGWLTEISHLSEGHRVAVHYGYNRKGRLTGERQTVHHPETGELLWQHETKHTYNEQGLANRFQADSLPPVEWLTYGSGYLAGMKLGDTPLVEYTRDRLHRETVRSFGNNAYELTSTYTPAGRLQSQHLNSLVYDRDYGWNDNGDLALISEDGNTMWSAEYDEWGNLLNEENPHHLYQPYRLPGQQYDDESGLCYNRNRYYDPLQGRYITQDPIGLSGGWNLYQYPLNPVHKVDPLGLSAWDDAKSGACHEGICRLFSVFIGPDKFDSTDDAAFEALKKTNGHSICQGVEHAGLVCKDKNNKYFYTPPKQGNVNTSYPFESPCPNGTETVAMYHTHGSDSNGVYGDEVFSPADKELSKNKAISSYLGTPKGSFQKVEPNGDQPMNKSGLPSQCRVHANGEIY
ncbi:DUF4329 domain-containing protein, partial [Escherichia coli]|nr:DUF4329 domain-containing protein [Escherichia coli]